jgi:hypothetical protein
LPHETRVIFNDFINGLLLEYPIIGRDASKLKRVLCVFEQSMPFWVVRYQIHDRQSGDDQMQNAAAWSLGGSQKRHTKEGDSARFNLARGEKSARTEREPTWPAKWDVCGKLADSATNLIHFSKSACE